MFELTETESLEPEVATVFFKEKVFLSIKEFQLVDLDNLAPDNVPSSEPMIIQVLMKCVKN